MPFKYGVLNPSDFAAAKKFERIPCNRGGQITFIQFGSIGAWWIMIDKPARPKVDFTWVVEPATTPPGVPVTLQSDVYLQEGDLYFIHDNPANANADILHYFLTWFEPCP